MAYKLTKNDKKDQWIVTIEGGGSFHTPSLELAMQFIEHHAGQADNERIADWKAEIRQDQEQTRRTLK